MGTVSISRLTVVGAGVIGHQIALDAALAGVAVQLHARTPAGLERARDSLGQSGARIVALGLAAEPAIEEARGRIHLSAKLDDSVAGAELVIEAVPEDPAVKRDVFLELAKRCGPDTVLASTTSSLLMGDITHGIDRPERVLVAHYFQPPFLIPLVEVARCEHTSMENFEAVCAFLERIGKQPVRIDREVPGLISSRLAFALMREAMALVELGVAQPAEIDTVMRTATLRRYAIGGMFQFLDFVGLDILQRGLEATLPHLDNARSVPPVLERLVAGNALGTKTGRGFYDWSPERTAEYGRRFTERMLETRWMCDPLA